MLRKVERQKALLVEEFGAELPADILQSLRPASTDNNCPPTASTNASEEAREIRVVNVNVTPTEMEKAVQTSLTEPSPIDKSVQVCFDCTFFLIPDFSIICNFCCYC